MRHGYVLGVVGLLACCSLLQAKGVQGFDCWTLGMTRAEVKSCGQHGPFVDVRVTGGLETANGDFEGTKTNISFVFGSDRLIKIQVWLCEQTDLETAVSSVTRAWRYLLREFGQTKLAGTLLAIDTSVEEFQARARTLAAALPPDKEDKFQLGPVSKPDGAAVWASVFRDPKYGYYVFLFVAKP